MLTAFLHTPSTFALSIPPSPLPAPAFPATILLVRAAPGSNDHALPLLGHRVMTAETGLGCLRTLAQEGSRIDLVLIEAGDDLPDLDWFFLCRAIKQRPSSRNHPVIMLLDVKLNGAVSQASSSGADDFLFSPPDLDQLALSINARLEGQPPAIAPMQTAWDDSLPVPEVLLACPAPEDARLYEMVLRLAGYRPVTVTSATQCLERLECQKEEFELVMITTLGMLGHLEALELCEELKRRAPGLPLVLLTGSADTESRGQALQHGVDLFLSKPFVPEELLARLEGLRTSRHVK